MSIDNDAWAAAKALKLFGEPAFKEALAKASRTAMKLMARVAAEAQVVDQVEVIGLYQDARRQFPLAISGRLLQEARREPPEHQLERLAALYGQVARLHYTVQESRR